MHLHHFWSFCLKVVHLHISKHEGSPWNFHEKISINLYFIVRSLWPIFLGFSDQLSPGPFVFFLLVDVLGLYMKCYNQTCLHHTRTITGLFCRQVTMTDFPWIQWSIIFMSFYRFLARRCSWLVYELLQSNLFSP